MANKFEDNYVRVDVNLDVVTPVRTIADVVNGRSRFVDGVVFNIVGVARRYFVEKDQPTPTTIPEDAVIHTVLTTNIPGGDAELWLSSWSEAKAVYDANDKRVELDGTFDKWMRQAMAHHSAMDACEFARRVAQALQGVQIKVRRKLYRVNKTSARRASVRCLDFVDPTVPTRISTDLSSIVLPQLTPSAQ